MDLEKLKEITKTASEVVKDLDENLKQSAFEAILNRLLDSSFGSEDKRINKKSRKSSPKQVVTRTTKPQSKSKSDEVTSELMTKLNRTDYPLLSKMTKIGDKAIYILKMALDKEQDGLMPSQIAYLLNEKFRQKGTQNAISMALMKSDFVDRKPITIHGGSGFSYHLTQPGEDYLKNLLEELTNSGN